MIFVLRSMTVGFASLLLLAGCGAGAAVGDGTQQPVYPVAGKITRNGAPVPDAIVTFSPRGLGPEAYGRTDQEGKFTLTTYAPADGAGAGEYLVLVVKTAPAAAVPVMHGPDFDSTKIASKPAAAAPAANPGLIPVKYASLKTTDLKATVKADGPNEITLDLK